MPQSGASYSQARQITAAREFQSLLEWKVDIKVLFSVAGTGAAPADTGSSTEFFTIVQPSITRSPESVYKALRSENDQLKRTHPVLFTFVQFNARFSSTVLEELARESKDSGNTEGFLIREVVNSFIGCNAIAQEPEELARTGAQTLAVHLFQQAVVVPQMRTNVQVADSYDYGVDQLGEYIFREGPHR